ncbi:hypothetical protein GCM10027514_13920 [Azotobacter armeniacus]
MRRQCRAAANVVALGMDRLAHRAEIRWWPLLCVAVTGGMGVNVVMDRAGQRHGTAQAERQAQAGE